MTQINNEKIVFDADLKIHQAILTQAGDTYQRSRILREPSVAILLFNTDTNCILLTRQFRYAIHDKSETEHLELPAGRIENKQSAEDTVRREVLEETGYDISGHALQKIAELFVTPGYSSEKLHLFYAEVSNSDKKEAGGGLPEEHELIEVIELPLNDFKSLVTSTQLTDLKTLTAGLWFLCRQKES